MKSNMNRNTGTLETFNQGYNCAQAILAVYGEEFGLDREHAFKIGAPFGGGIANTGDICGAVTGALMVLGLRYGETKSSGWFKTAKLYRTSRTFMKRFADAGGSIKCVEIKDRLTGEHGSVKRGVHCTNVVENATRILEELL